jgi:hypothetical protein
LVKSSRQWQDAGGCGQLAGDFVKNKFDSNIETHIFQHPASSIQHPASSIQKSLNEYPKNSILED